MIEGNFIPVNMFIDSDATLHTNQVKELLEDKFKFVVQCDNGHLTDEDINSMGCPVVVLVTVMNGTFNKTTHFEMEGENRACASHGVYISSTDSRYRDMFGNIPLELHMPTNERIIPNY